MRRRQNVKFMRPQPALYKINLILTDLAKHAEINLASIRILDTLDGRVQISYLRRSNRVNSIKRKEGQFTLVCQFRAATMGLCYNFPDIWMTGTRLLCGCRTRVLITSRSLESAEFCSSLRWNLLTPKKKIIRIESMSIWRDNERKTPAFCCWITVGFKWREGFETYPAKIWVRLKWRHCKYWSILDREQQVPLTNTLPYITFVFSVHRSISQMKHHLDVTLCRFYFCRVTLHVSGVKCPSSGVLKNWHGSQLDVTLCRFYFCRVTLHVSGVKRPSSGLLKNWHGGPWYRCYSCR